MKHSCVRVHVGESASAPSRHAVCRADVVPGWEYARLRFDLVRLARQVAGPAAADDLVQQVFRHVAKHGPAAPRDHRGLPRPAYLTSLLFAFAAPEMPGTPEHGASAGAAFGPGDRTMAAAPGARGG